ncbi:MAG: recombination protein NinG [Aeromonadaceae bacterium]
MNSKRKCKQCGSFVSSDSGVKTPSGFFCCHDHAIRFAMEKSAKQRERQAAKARRESESKAKEARKELRARKLAVKPIAYFRAKAKAACHLYIRTRDEGMPCPCCEATSAVQWDAAHYRPAGVNSALKFDERNIHRCCQVCNQHKSGNLTMYRMWMVKKYGEEFVQSLDNNHEIRRYTRAELEEIEALYKRKLKELKENGQ